MCVCVCVHACVCVCACVRACVHACPRCHLPQGALDSWLKFQRFLEKVVESSDDFAEIENVLSWQDTLSATNKDLQLVVTERMESMELTRAQLADTVKTLQNDILVKNSLLASLREQLERERQSSMVGGGGGCRAVVGLL